MIKTEIIEIDGHELVYTYSDADYKIHKIGTDEVYEDVIDIVGHLYEYEETNIKRNETESFEDELLAAALEDINDG